MSAAQAFTKAISWEEYMEHRPPYPPSMWDLWLDYHQGPLDSAHDVGAGGGVAAHGLAARRSNVKKIYVSDPGKDHLDHAQAMLTRSHLGVEFVFRHAAAEDAWLPDGSVDFVCCCEALHWVDVDMGMPTLARSLRPGGTFAALYYLPQPRIANSARAQAAQTRLLDAFGRAVPDAAVAHPSWRRGFANGNAGLDFVPLDPTLWADARRIEINVDPSRGWPSSAEIAARFGVAPNRVPEGFVKEHWEDDQWKTVASPERLRQILAKFLGAPDDTWDSDDWREVLDAAKEVGGKLELHFQVAMVLARKK